MNQFADSKADYLYVVVYFVTIRVTLMITCNFLYLRFSMRLRTLLSEMKRLKIFSVSQNDSINVYEQFYLNLLKNPTIVLKRATDTAIYSALYSCHRKN